MLPPPPDIVNYGNQNTTTRLEEPLKSKTHDLLDLTVRRRAHPTRDVIDQRHLSDPIEKRRYIPNTDSYGNLAENAFKTGETVVSAANKLTTQSWLYKAAGELTPKEAHLSHTNAKVERRTESLNRPLTAQNEISKMRMIPSHQHSMKPTNGLAVTEAEKNKNSILSTGQSTGYRSGSFTGNNPSISRKTAPQHSTVWQTPTRMPYFAANNNHGISGLQQKFISDEQMQMNAKGVNHIYQEEASQAMYIDLKSDKGIKMTTPQHSLSQHTGFEPHYYVYNLSKNQPSSSKAINLKPKPSMVQSFPHLPSGQVCNQSLDTDQHRRMQSTFDNCELPTHFQQSSCAQFQVAPGFISSPGSRMRGQVPMPFALSYPVSEAVYTANSTAANLTVQTAGNGFAFAPTERISRIGYGQYGTKTHSAINSALTLPQTTSSVRCTTVPSGFNSTVINPSKPRTPPPPLRMYSNRDGTLHCSLKDHPERYLMDNCHKKRHLNGSEWIIHKQSGPQFVSTAYMNNGPNDKKNKMAENTELAKMVNISQDTHLKGQDASPLAMLVNLHPGEKKAFFLSNAAASHHHLGNRCRLGPANEGEITSVDLTNNSLDLGDESEISSGDVNQRSIDLCTTKTNSNIELVAQIPSTTDPALKTHPSLVHDFKSKQDGQSLSINQNLKTALPEGSESYNGGLTRAKIEEADILALRQRIAAVWSQMLSSSKNGEQFQKTNLPFAQRLDIQRDLSVSALLFKKDKTVSSDDHEEAMKQLGLSKRSDRV